MIHKSKIAISIIVIFLSLFSFIHIFLTIYSFRNIPFPWDPAAHAYEGLIISKDLINGDIISFLCDTYRQGWWPFFHSWLLAPAFILLGNTYLTARVVSLFCFILYIPIIYWIGREMCEKNGHWIGLIAAFLSLSSMPLLGLSAMCMSEVPGLLMSFLTFLLYLKAERQRKTYLFFLASVCMAFTLFTKWHHGVFVIPAIFLTRLTYKAKFFSRDNYYLFIPFFVIIIVWFFHPQHVLSFYGHSTFQPHYFDCP